MDSLCKKPLALLLALTMLFSAAFMDGCRKGTDEKPKQEDKTEKEDASSSVVIELPPDPPAVGVGRIMPVTVKQRDQLIVIDAGHGFDDPGNGDAPESYWKDLDVRERDVTLVVAKMLDEELQKKGFRTLMTHNGVDHPDYDFDYHWLFNPNERVAFVNSLDPQPDYFISVHVNSTGNQNACGAIVFYTLNSYYKWNDWSGPASESIAKAIDEMVEITASTRTENETTQLDASYAVTRETHVAASLVEMGFATNEGDAERMLNPDWQRSMAEAIATGIARFFDEMES